MTEVVVLVSELGNVAVLADRSGVEPALLGYFDREEADARTQPRTSLYGDPRVEIEGDDWWITAVYIGESDGPPDLAGHDVERSAWQQGHIERWTVLS